MTAEKKSGDGARPLVSVVIEGYNESRQLGTASETVRCLARQRYPLDRVEVILVGSREQARAWEKLYAEPAPFLSVKAVAQDENHYYVMKNAGARAAGGDIVAFTDSDVRPEESWLSSAVGAIEAGADVAVGLSLFRGGRRGPGDALMQAAASVTWGWVVGKGAGAGGACEPVGFMDHNVVLRARALRRNPYATGNGRVCTSTLLFKSLKEDGARFALPPGQRAAHHFTWGYWLRKLHFRYGYEVYALRRMDETYPNRWIMRARVLEPLATMCWHMMLDVPRWLRFSRLLGLGPARRAALLPVVAALSLVARGAEMAGMCATLVAPSAMRAWAEKV